MGWVQWDIINAWDRVLSSVSEISFYPSHYSHSGDSEHKNNYNEGALICTKLYPL